MPATWERSTICSTAARSMSSSPNVSRSTPRAAIRALPFCPVGSSERGSTTRAATGGNPLCSAVRVAPSAAMRCAASVTSLAA